MNEAETRAKLIDPKLHECGWKEGMIEREKVLSRGMIINESGDRLPLRKPDYILYYPEKNSILIAVIEAEAENKSHLAGMLSRAEEEWGFTKLAKICKINPSKSEIRALPDDIQVTFVPMVAVSEITGRIEKPEARLLGDVRKGYTYFREKDVLFAKITPCMENGKSAIARNLINGLGFGSTEFHVLRPLDGMLPEWVYYYIRQKSFRDYAARYMTGSVGQQRVPIQFMKNVEIPSPHIEEQKRMVTYLDRIRETVESLKKLQQETEGDLEKIVPAILDRAYKGEYDSARLEKKLMKSH